MKINGIEKNQRTNSAPARVEVPPDLDKPMDLEVSKQSSLHPEE